MASVDVSLSPSAVDVSDLEFAFGKKPTVGPVSFSLAAGSITAIVGPNGAGKTTLLRLLLGMLRPHAGQIAVFGEPVRVGRCPAEAGAILEEPRFYPWASGRANLQAVCAGRRDWLARVPDVLDRVGLANRADDRVGEYSQGMRQRLGIARALLGDPSLLVLDEPTNGLDPLGIRWLREFLHAHRAGGGTAIVASHMISEVERVATDLIVLRDGRSVVAGPLGVLVGDDDLESYCARVLERPIEEWS